ncbi:MAG: Phosphate-specific transport system accessory protein PhoU [Alphaproteobacteria bacterium UBA4588]|nr:MAG: Phosphate-specific transport system accessory protein PhoU [Alphaproteobacteria bacterium UBA4588]
MANHIVKSYDEVLDVLRALVNRMGNDIVAMNDKAVTSLLAGDVEAARAVILADKNINQMELEIREQASAILALRSPMANDLRVVITSIQIAINLERAGDLAKNISKIGLKTTLVIDHDMRGELEKISQLAISSLSNTMTAYITRDTERSYAIREADLLLDKMHKTFTKSLMHKIRENEDNLETITQLLFASRHLERVGDHAKNIAEATIYMETGALSAIEQQEDTETT